MMENNLYNLMVQIVEEHKSLWRIRNEYVSDSLNYPESQAFFKKLAEQKEMIVSELTSLIKMEINK